FVGRLSLIQPNAPDFHARLEGVTAMDPTEIVDDSEGSADFHVFRVVVKLHKRVGSYGKRQGARLRMVERSAVDVALYPVEEGGGEGMLQRHQIIRGVVDGPKAVSRDAADGRFHQADVPPSAAIE